MTEGPSPAEDLIAPDLILLLLHAPTVVREGRDHLNGITRLEKLLYLVAKEGSLSDEVGDPFVFQPFHYGPYSKAIYESVDLLEAAGLLREERALEGQALDEMEELSAVTSEREGIERRFFLTREGQAVASLLASKHPDTVSALTRIKDKYAGMPLRRLIRYVYSRYPDSAAASRIRDEIL